MSAEPITYAEILRDTRLPTLENRMLLEHVTGASRTQVIAHPEFELSAADASRLEDLLQRRAAGEPMAYLLGQREFFGRDFAVSPAVLIPRPDTELLVELALTHAPRTARVLDLGTGSGVIAVTLAAERGDLTVTATDVAPKALAVATANAARHGVRVRFLTSDWYQDLDRTERFELIVSNPPYIRPDDPHLNAGDLRFEPKDALTDFDDGLAALRALTGGASARLEAGGWLLLEHGYDQASAVRQLLNHHGFVEVQSWRDLGGNERVTGGRRPAAA